MSELKINEEKIDKLANLAVKRGVGLQKGQNQLITAPFVALPILRKISETEFPNLSMLGPVCVNFDDEKKFIMNGGFSFRDKKLMQELCKNEIITSKVEDIFFTEQIRKFYPELMPSMRECNDFAIESIGNKLKVKGIHGTDKYYYSYNNFKELINILKNSN